ncbi:hypothetical protein Bca4012_082245 [Brassica carinata]
MTYEFGHFMLSNIVVCFTESSNRNPLLWHPIISCQHPNLKVKKVPHFRIYLVLLCSFIYGSPSRLPPSPLLHFMFSEFGTVTMSISIGWEMTIYVNPNEYSKTEVHDSILSDQGIRELPSYTVVLRGLLPLLTPYAHHILILPSSEGRLPSETVAYRSQTLSIGISTSTTPTIVCCSKQQL